MNYINDYALKYHEQIIKLNNEVSEVCEDSRYVLGKYTDIRWDILVKTWIKRDNHVRGLKTELIILDELRDGEPCKHPGCLNHMSHPCEGCGRVNGR